MVFLASLFLLALRWTQCVADIYLDVYINHKRTERTEFCIGENITLICSSPTTTFSHFEMIANGIDNFNYSLDDQFVVTCYNNSSNCSSSLSVSVFQGLDANITCSDGNSSSCVQIRAADVFLVWPTVSKLETTLSSLTINFEANHCTCPNTTIVASMSKNKTTVISTVVPSSKKAVTFNNLTEGSYLCNISLLSAETLLLAEYTFVCRTALTSLAATAYNMLTSPDLDKQITAIFLITAMIIIKIIIIAVCCIFQRRRLKRSQEDHDDDDPEDDVESKKEAKSNGSDSEAENEDHFNSLKKESQESHLASPGYKRNQIVPLCTILSDEIDKLMSSGTLGTLATGQSMTHSLQNWQKSPSPVIGITLGPSYEMPRNTSFEFHRILCDD